jgi:hypothetical protein
MLLPLAPTWAQQKPVDVERTNPRPDVGLSVDDKVLEVPFFIAVAAVDEPDDDDEDAASSSAAKDPKARRDPGPREESEGDKPATKRESKEVRIFRFDGEGGEKSIEALEKTLAELKELAARKAAVSDKRAHEEIERAIDRLQVLVQKRRAEPAAAENRKPGADRPRARKPENVKEGPEAEERRAEIARLKAEVAERHKAWMEAQKRLADAMRRLALAGAVPGPMARSERFEFRVDRQGAGPLEQEKSIRIVPRADQEKRIAELEERLEKLLNEVKSLKKETPATK